MGLDMIIQIKGLRDQTGNNSQGWVKQGCHSETNSNQDGLRKHNFGDVLTRSNLKLGG